MLTLLVPPYASEGSTCRVRCFFSQQVAHRPTALDVLDGDSLPLGLPSYLPMSTSKRMLSLYTVRLHPPGPVNLTPEPLLPAAKVGCGQ